MRRYLDALAESDHCAMKRVAFRWSATGLGILIKRLNGGACCMMKRVPVLVECNVQDVRRKVEARRLVHDDTDTATVESL
jgi:hypothetical protein